mmetsp:Transcript_26308/g.54936  ORF Transcript_26308/g.54936 Transcript_26308/m.54936 type:complete len:311 (+) Transcript_26308:455-1387(+)
MNITPEVHTMQGLQLCVVKILSFCHIWVRLRRQYFVSYSSSSKSESLTLASSFLICSISIVTSVVLLQSIDELLFQSTHSQFSLPTKILQLRHPEHFILRFVIAFKKVVTNASSLGRFRPVKGTYDILSHLPIIRTKEKSLPFRIVRKHCQTLRKRHQIGQDPLVPHSLIPRNHGRSRPRIRRRRRRRLTQVLDQFPFRTVQDVQIRLKLRDIVRRERIHKPSHPIFHFHHAVFADLAIDSSADENVATVECYCADLFLVKVHIRVFHLNFLLRFVVLDGGRFRTGAVPFLDFRFEMLDQIRFLLFVNIF